MYPLYTMIHGYVDSEYTYIHIDIYKQQPTNAGPGQARRRQGPKKQGNPTSKLACELASSP